MMMGDLSWIEVVFVGCILCRRSPGFVLELRICSAQRTAVRRRTDLRPLGALCVWHEVHERTSLTQYRYIITREPWTVSLYRMLGAPIVAMDPQLVLFRRQYLQLFSEMPESSNGYTSIASTRTPTLTCLQIGTGCVCLSHW